MTQRGKAKVRSIHDALSKMTILLGVLFIVAMVVCMAIVGWGLYSWSIGLEDYDVGHPLESKPASEPSWTMDGAQIVFEYQGHIYIVDAGGGEVKAWIPQGAPDGKDNPFAGFNVGPVVTSAASSPRIAFYTLRHSEGTDLDFDIGTARLDGSGYRRLTDSGRGHLAPAWSPDGKRIAFLSSDAGSGNGLYMMNADGSDIRLVTSNFSFPSRFTRPLWSPDGVHLALRGRFSLHVADDVLESKAIGAFNLGLTDVDPAWSPDSQWIAFAQIGPTHATQETATLYVSRPDGAEAREVLRLYRGSRFTDISWSPDGSVLRFAAFMADYNKRALYRIGIDGSGLREIAEVEWSGRVVWSPDTTRVAVSFIWNALQGGGNNEILLYTMASDGSDKRVLVRQGENGPEAANGR